MKTYDEEWRQRHIAAFRTHRGHGACTVDGCIGSQPLVWVPTLSEVLAELIRSSKNAPGAAIDWPSPVLAEMWLRRFTQTRTGREAHQDHIHWDRPQLRKKEQG